METSAKTAMNVNDIFLAIGIYGCLLAGMIKTNYFMRYFRIKSAKFLSFELPTRLLDRTLFCIVFQHNTIIVFTGHGDACVFIECYSKEIAKG
jgi:hypothetical protein